MRIYTLVLLLLPLSAINAGVYTWVDEEGNTHFSDTPKEGAKKVEVQDSMSYTPPATPAGGKLGKDAGTADKALIKYTEISIDQPENEATVRSNEGKVVVSIGVKPGLQAGHQIKVYLDGKQLSGTSGTSAIELRGVNRGSHNLAAAIVDRAGKELIRSANVTFHLQKQSINLPPRRPTPTPPIRN